MVAFCFGTFSLCLFTKSKTTLLRSDYLANEFLKEKIYPRKYEDKNGK